MATPKDQRNGIPAFLFSVNAINNNVFITHTQHPRCLLKVYRDEDRIIRATVVMLFDTENVTPKMVQELEEKAATKYFYFQKQERA